MRWRSDGRSAGGFTLLEMLAVIVVLGLALAVIVGRMPRPGPGATLGMAARTV
ncbi:MAG: type II secretion system protein, partial [Acetobacteraceae bacterium]